MNRDPPEASRSSALPRGFVVLLSLAATVVIVAGLRAAHDLVAPAFLALVLTIAIQPVRPWLVERGLPAWAATSAALLGVYLMVLLLALSLVVSVARFATLLTDYEGEFDDLVDGLRDQLADLGVGGREIETVLGSVDLERLAGYAGDLLGGVLGAMSSLLFVVTLLFFLSLDAALLPARLRRAATHHAPIVSALQSFAWGTRRYLVVSSVFGLIVAAIDTTFLWLLGIPAPLLWGLLAFITNYIPNIGFVVGLVPPAALALLEGGPGLMLLVVGMYSVVNFVIQSIIQPRYVGDAVGLSGTITFLSLVFWAWVLGAIGALLAVPLTLLAKALLIDSEPGSAWIRPLLAGRALAADPAVQQVPEPRRSP